MACRDGCCRQTWVRVRFLDFRVSCTIDDYPCLEVNRLEALLANNRSEGYLVTQAMKANQSIKQALLESVDGQLTKILHQNLLEKEFEIEKPEFDTQPAEERNDQLGKYILARITDWQWINRRVERIQVVDEGYTQRQISFDFNLPYSSCLKYPVGSNDKDHDRHFPQSVVPLTFLRKGMLVNLSILNEEGSTVPSLNFDENGLLTYRAIKYLLNNSSIMNYAEQIPLASSLHLGHKLSRQDFIGIYLKAISEIIYSSNYDQKAVEGAKIVERAQETHRRDLFDSIAACAAARKSFLLGETSKTESISPNFEILFSYWALGARFDDVNDLKNKKNRGLINDTETPYVLDSSIYVELLALSLMIAVANCDDVVELTTFETICILLSLVSASYLCVVVIDSEVLWDSACREESGQPSVASPVSRRTVVKIACNVEINDNSLDAPKKSAIKRLINLGCKDSPYLDVLVRYSARSAKSSHLEFAFPPELRLKSVLAFRAPKRRVRKQYLHSQRPYVWKVGYPKNCACREKYYPCVDCEDEIASKSNRATYRSSFQRAHVQPRGAATPLETLSFRLVSERLRQPLLAVITTFLCCILCVFGLYGANTKWCTGWMKWLDISNILAVVTLLSALFGAYLLTAFRHAIARRAFSFPKYIIAGSGLLAVLAFGILFAFLILADLELVSSESVRGSLVWGGVIVILLPLILLIRMLMVFYSVTKANLRQVYQEHIVREVFPEVIHDRNVVAITETGGYDLEYIEDSFLRSVGLGYSADEYIATLVKHLNEEIL